jgi:hypothetical protein
MRPERIANIIATLMGCATFSGIGIYAGLYLIWLSQST